MVILNGRKGLEQQGKSWLWCQVKPQDCKLRVIKLEPRGRGNVLLGKSTSSFLECEKVNVTFLFQSFCLPGTTLLTIFVLKNYDYGSFFFLLLVFCYIIPFYLGEGRLTKHSCSGQRQPLAGRQVNTSNCESWSGCCGTAS